MSAFLSTIRLEITLTLSKALADHRFSTHYPNTFSLLVNQLKLSILDDRITEEKLGI